MGASKTIEWRGKTFQITEGSTHPAYSLNMFEEELGFRERYWNVKEGEVVFDVGSSYGAYALPACSSGATVHAFEPEPPIFADLVRNVELNGWNQRFVGACHGLWSEPTQVDMRSYAPHWPSQTISGAYGMTTLDDVVAERRVERMDWLKVDVEGAELHVLQGGLGAIRRLKPRLIVEVHTFLKPTLLPAARDMLEWLGYALEEVPRDPCVMLVGAPKVREVR